MDKNKIYIIAEIGVTCNYDLKITKQLIKEAKKSGADAVKFVFHFPDELMSDKDVLYTYKTTKGDVTENMFDMFESLRFSLDEWFVIKEECEKLNIDFFASVDCNSGIEWGEKLGFKYYKLGTWDVNDIVLLKKLATLNKPVIVDVGASPESEIERMIDILGSNNTIILHDYHTDKFEEMNMCTIKYLKQKYNIITGYSSPNSYDVNDYISVAMGASVIEKRLTLSKDLEGHHHIISKTPEEFKEWVKNIRQAELAIGKYGVHPSSNDLKERKEYFKCICFDKDLSKGTVITEDMLACKRPEKKGMIPLENFYGIVGNILTTDVKRNEAVKITDLSDYCLNRELLGDYEKYR